MSEPHLLNAVEKTCFLQLPQWLEPVESIWDDIEEEVSRIVEDEGMLFVWRRRWISDCAGIERWGRRCKVIGWMESLAEKYPRIIASWPSELPPWEIGIEDPRAHLLVPEHLRDATEPVDEEAELRQALTERIPLRWEKVPDWIPSPLIKGAAAMSSLGDPRLHRAGLREAIHQYGLPRVRPGRRTFEKLPASRETIDLLFLI